MSLDFTPAAGAARPWPRVRAHALTEARMISRNHEQQILALVIPLGLLVAARLFGERLGTRLDAVAPGVLALAIWSTAFTSVAISTGFERRYGVLERLAATPLGRTGLLAGKALATIMVAGVQVAILATVALALGWRPEPGLAGSVALLVGVLLALIAFTSFALVLAGTLAPEVVLGLANLIYLIGAGAGGLLVPLASYPSALRPFVSALPTAALGELLRGWASGGSPWWTLPVLAAWAVVLLRIARKVFRWTS